MSYQLRGFILIAGIILAAPAPALQAEQAWSGQISDSLCGARHEQDADTAGGGRQGTLTDRQCTQACVRGGSKYVFVTDEKVYQIVDQKDPALDKFAGETVKLTGEMKGNVITVSRIEMP